jgi:putative ABC transport system substrate-binding protein
LSSQYYALTSNRQEIGLSRLSDIAFRSLLSRLGFKGTRAKYFRSPKIAQSSRLVVPGGPFFDSISPRLVAFAAKLRLPTIYGIGSYATQGGLMSYSVNIFDVNRRVAGYVDRILKGAKPGDLPVEQPTKFELIINLKTAKTLGLTIPQPLLLRANQVIQ